MENWENEFAIYADRAIKYNYSISNNHKKQAYIFAVAYYNSKIIDYSFKVTQKEFCKKIGLNLKTFSYYTKESFKNDIDKELYRIFVLTISILDNNMELDNAKS